MRLKLKNHNFVVFFFPASLTATFFSGACMFFRGAVNVATCWVLHAPSMSSSSSTRKSEWTSRIHDIHGHYLPNLCENHYKLVYKPLYPPLTIVISTINHWIQPLINQVIKPNFSNARIFHRIITAKSPCAPGGQRLWQPRGGWWNTWLHGETFERHWQLDWFFYGKILTGNPWVLYSFYYQINIELSGSNFPIIQFYESWISSELNV